MLKYKIGKTAFFALALFFLPLLLRGQGRFQRFDFSFRGAITDIITEDLDNDKLKDLIIIHIDKSADPPGRFLTIIPQVPKRGFDKKNKIEWPIPPEVSSIDVGDIAPEPGKELIFLTDKGIYYSSVKSGKVGPLKELFPAQSVVAFAYERGVPYYSLARDYTGSGKDDLLVVGFYDALFAKQKDNYQFSQQKIHLRPRMSIQSFDMGKLLGSDDVPNFQVVYHVPRVYSADTNSDGLPDLIVTSLNKIQYFLQNAQGFTQEPAKSFSIDIIKDTKSKRRQDQYPNFAFNDLDKDGRVDVIASQITGNIGNMKSRTLLFWGRDNKIEKNIPSVEFSMPNPAMGIFIKDANKDGLLDIIFPTMDWGAWAAGKAIITSGIPVHWNFFLQTKDHNFHAIPDRSFSTELKFNITKLKLDNGIPNIFGDYNGDGCLDQSVGEEKGILTINLRDCEGKLTGIEEKITIPVSLFNRAGDLNNDGLTDIIIHYEDDSEYAGELHVFMNVGPWTKKVPEKPKAP